MIPVTAADLQRRGVARRTAYRWFASLRRDGRYEERPVSVRNRRGATHTAVALLVPEDVLAALPGAA